MLHRFRPVVACVLIPVQTGQPWAGKGHRVRAGRIDRLGIGAIHHGKRILALIDETTVTITRPDTGEIIATNNTIDPTRGYWRNTRREPGRWQGSR